MASGVASADGTAALAGSPSGAAQYRAVGPPVPRISDPPNIGTGTPQNARTAALALRLAADAFRVVQTGVDELASRSASRLSRKRLLERAACSFCSRRRLSSVSLAEALLWFGDLGCEALGGAFGVLSLQVAELAEEDADAADASPRESGWRSDPDGGIRTAKPEPSSAPARARLPRSLRSCPVVAPHAPRAPAGAANGPFPWRRDRQALGVRRRRLAGGAGGSGCGEGLLRAGLRG
jgi:hypothetical protein